MDPTVILQSLTEIANAYTVLAFGWHIYFGVVIVNQYIGRRLSSRSFMLAMAPPLLSVSAIAVITGNPFNGVVFGLSALTALAISLKEPDRGMRIGSIANVIVGVTLFTFGWVYPHFLDNAEFTKYLYASPLGLIPCPTLSAIIGLGLIFSGLQSRAWSMTHAILGSFYGFFGMVRLGVVIDFALAIGGLALLSTAYYAKWKGSPTREGREVWRARSEVVD